MWELFLYLMLLILPIAFIYSINKYKLFESQKGLDRLYSYSKYLIYEIKDENIFKKPKYIKIFKKDIKNKETIFYVLYTNSRVISAEKIEYVEENFNKLFNDLKKTCKNKELKISFYDLKNANLEEKNFFWSIINYKYFRFVEFITWANISYTFTFIIALALILFTLLSQKTLYMLGIPQQLSLMNIFEFAQFILNDNSTNAIANILFSVGIITISLMILWLILHLPIKAYLKNKKKPHIPVFDFISIFGFSFCLFLIYVILIIILALPFVSIIKMNFPNSIFTYRNVMTTAYEYIQYTGYPRVANINGKKSYIAGYHGNNLYYYNLEKTNDSFYNFKKKIDKKKKNTDSLLKACKSIIKYKKEKDDKTHDIDNIHLNIILLNNQYLKPKYIKNISKADAKIKHETLLEYSNIIHKDINCECKKYIKKYSQILEEECQN